MKEQLREGEVDLAQTMRNLASAKLRLGDLDGVDDLYRQSLEELLIAESNPGDIGKSWRGLAAYYLEVARPVKSESASREALESLYRAGGEQETTRIASVRTGLARALHDQVRLPEALEEYEKAIEIRRRMLTDNHLHVTSSHLDLARVRIDLGHFDEAAEHLAIARAWLGKKPAHWHGQYRARADVLTGVLRMRQGLFDDQTHALLRGGTERLIGDRTRPDHYGRRAVGWLDELARNRGTPR